MPTDILRQIIGTFASPDSTVYANQTLTWYRVHRKVTPHGDTTVIDQPFYIQTDASGQIDDEVYSGYYMVLAPLSDGDRYFNVTVPDEVGPHNVADLLDYSELDDPALSQVQQLVLKARAWAENPEDVEVDSVNYPGEYSAKHHSAKAAATLADFETKYLGAFAADPTLDNAGNPLIVGALYWNTVFEEMLVYNGTSWTLQAADYASRAALVSDWTDGDKPDGRILSDGKVMYEARTGNTDIPDLPGLRPFGVVYPEHFGADTAATDNATAINAWLAYLGAGVIGAGSGSYDVQSPIVTGEIDDLVLIANNMTLNYTGATTTGTIFHFGSSSATSTRVRIQGLKLTSDTTMTSGDSVVFERIARSSFRDVIIDGQDGTKKFYNGCWIKNCGTLFWDGYDFTAQKDGLILSGTAGVGAAEYRFSNGRILYCTEAGLHVAGGIGGLYVEGDIGTNKYNVKTSNERSAQANREIFFKSGCVIDITQENGYGVYIVDTVANENGLIQFDAPWVSSADEANIFVGDLGFNGRLILNGGKVFNAGVSMYDPSTGTNITATGSGDGIFSANTSYKLEINGTTFEDNAGTALNQTAANANTKVRGVSFDGNGTDYTLHIVPENHIANGEFYVNGGLIPPTVTIEGYGAFNQTNVDAMEAEHGYIRVGTEIDVASNTTVSTPIFYDFGASTDVQNGVTLTIRNTLSSVVKQHVLKYTGTGTYVLEHSTTSDTGENARMIHASMVGVFPDPDTGADQGPAIERAFGYMGTGRESIIEFDIGNYNVDSQIDVTRGGTVRGVGTRKTVFKTATDGFPIFNTTGDACFFEGIQFETHSSLSDRTSPWIKINDDGCVVDRVNMGETSAGVLVAAGSVGTRIGKINATYGAAKGAGSYLIGVQGSTVDIKDIFLPSSSLGPESIVLIGSAATISEVSVSNMRWQSPAIGVSVDATAANVSRVSIDNLRHNQFTGLQCPALVKIKTGSTFNASNVSATKLFCTGFADYVMDIVQASSGETEDINIDDVSVVGAGSGYVVRATQTAGNVRELNIGANISAQSRETLTSSGVAQTEIYQVVRSVGAGAGRYAQVQGPTGGDAGAELLTDSYGARWFVDESSADIVWQWDPGTGFINVARYEGGATETGWHFVQPTYFDSAATFKSTFSLESAAPVISIYETDGAIGTEKETIRVNGGTFAFQQRDAANNAIANNYTMNRNASGATKHTWLIGGAERLHLDDDGIGVEGVISQKVYTVASLPAGVEGDRAFVTDANSTTFASVVAGGGSNNVPVFYDGVNWKIG